MSLLLDDIRALLLRDLAGLQREIELYPDDRSLWEVRDGVTNSAGNLALHLAGNLRFFIGHVAGCRTSATARPSSGGVPGRAKR